MAQEIRKIEFNMAETHEALKVFFTKTGQELLPGSLTKMTSDPGVPGRLIALFDQKTMDLRDKDMLTALLVFCQDKSIPIPKDGKKMVKGEGDKVVILLKRG